MKTFLIIMGAGRCGTTSTMSFLNSHDNFNIYGENDSIVYDILHGIQRIKKIHSTKPKELDSKVSILSHKNSCHIGVEWYNPRKKLENLESNLLKCILNYFDNDEKYIGFKEVRWINRKLECLNILEDHFKVKYIYLTRNLYDQVKSIQKVGWNLADPIDQHIEKTNSVIEAFLNKKKSSQFIHKNISTDANFLQEIYQFIVSDAEKKSSSRIDNADT